MNTNATSGLLNPSAPKFVCLNCGMEMVNRQCKVRCVRCGYFEDCSDGTGDHVNIQVTNA